jgi:hypothetical protein
MPEKSMPAFKQLFVHRSINIMKMNRLERFQELIGSVEKTSPLLDGERADVFQANPPDSFQFSILHERFGDLAQGRRRGVLRRKLGHTRAPMHLQREV